MVELLRDGVWPYQNRGIVEKSTRIERDVVEASDQVLAVTRTITRQMRERYPDQPEDKFVTVSNGYDPALFQGFAARKNTTGRVVIAHVGTVYGTASPRFHLDGLDNLGTGKAERFETRFIGRIAPTEEGTLADRKSMVT